MIKCVKRDNLDVKKWNQCVESSPYGRIYAMSYYLDAVCTTGTWAGLVADDYAAVMPLPINQRIPFFPRIMLPHFSQQLGVFAENDPSPAMIAEFIAAIPDTYKSVYVQLNDANPVQGIHGKEVQSRSNYILPLRQNHEVLIKNYSTNLKRNIKKGAKAGLSVDSLSVAEFIPFYLAYDKSKYTQKSKTLDVLGSLLPILIEREEAIIYAAQDEQQNILAACVITIFNKRLTYLMANSSTDGKEKRAMPWLIDQIILQHSATMDYLDFEGSDMPGIAKFFDSFGAELRPYYLIRYERFPFSLIS